MKMQNKLFSIQPKGFYQITKEEMSTYGTTNIGVKELIAIIIGSSADMETCSQLASLPKNRFTSLTATELRSLYGIPETAAQRLVAAISLAKKTGHNNVEQITCPADAAKALSYIANEEQEHFVALLLDTKNKVKQKVTITIGTADSSLAHPREVFKLALRESASAIIVGHNHPSGDPTPSVEDISITRRLVDAGKLVGMRVLDHVIIAGERWVSLIERGVVNDN
jgi:DNA repair protein RadC